MRANGEFYQFRAGVQIEAIHDALPMTGNRLVAEAQASGDLEVGVPLRDQFEHLALPRTQDGKARSSVPSLGASSAEGWDPERRW